MQSVLAQYGQRVIITTAAGETEVRAFLQPVTEKSEQVPETYGGLGWMDERLWLYLGRTALETEDQVVWRGLTFRVRSCRPYYVGEELSHYWASLELAKEAAE